MNLVDVLLGVSFLVAVAHGWRMGIIRGVFGLLGLLGGGWLALQVVPFAIDALDLNTAWRIASGVGLLAAAALAGEVVGTAIGSAVRRLLHWSPIRFIDSALGSAFRLTSLALVVWLLASAMSVLPDRGVLHLVRTSGIVALLDEYAPDAASRATAALRQAIRHSRFPVVFAGIMPTPRSEVSAPDKAILRDPDVVRAYDFVYQVEAESKRCGERMSGTGFVYAPGRVLTNAHVVAGAEEVSVRSSDSGRSFTARVVAFDSELDAAVLAVPGLPAGTLEFSGPAKRGAAAAIPGFTGGRPLSPDAARVADRVLARGHDIYGSARVDREIYVLRAPVAPGDSGAPLLGDDGRVQGMVFAAATDEDNTGYALTARALEEIARQGSDSTRSKSTGQCLR